MLLPELPHLCFTDGDVVIKLGESPQDGDWLLFPKESEIVINPRTEKEAQVTCFALKWVSVDSTYFIEGNDFVKHPSPLPPNCSPDFAEFIYAPPGCPSPAANISYMYDHLQYVSKTVKAFIAMACGYKISLGAIVPFEMPKEHEWWEERDSNIALFHNAANYVVTVCAHAEYYGSLPRIAPSVIEALKAEPLLWVAVANDPTRYLAIAVKLRDAELFFEAARHRIGMQCDWPQSSDPSGFLRMQAGSRLESLFDLGGNDVEGGLNVLVLRAASIINEVFEPSTEYTNDGRVLEFRRSHFDSPYNGHCSYFPLEECKLPWADQDKWGCLPLPSTNTEPADIDVVAVLGGHRSSYASEAERDECDSQAESGDDADDQTSEVEAGSAIMTISTYAHEELGQNHDEQESAMYTVLGPVTGSGGRGVFKGMDRYGGRYMRRSGRGKGAGFRMYEDRCGPSKKLALR